jgi:hypothetical protein
MFLDRTLRARRAGGNLGHWKLGRGWDLSRAWDLDVSLDRTLQARRAGWALRRCKLGQQRLGQWWLDRGRLDR